MFYPTYHNIKRFFLFFSSIVILPIFLFLYHDSVSLATWDGVLIENAIVQNNLDLLKNFLFDSGWFLQYYFIVSLSFLSDIFDLNFRTLNFYFLLFIYGLFVFEISHLLLNKLKVDFSLFLSFLLLITLSPIFTALTSEILTFHFLMYVIGLMSVRLYNSSHFLSKLIGILFIFLSFNLLSNLVFVPIYSFFYSYFFSKRFSAISLMTPLLFAIIFYTFYTILFVPSGAFVGYHKFIIFSPSGILPFLLGASKFLSFFIPLSFLILFILSFVNSKNTFSDAPDIVSFPNGFIFGLFALSFASIFPYMATASTSLIWDFDSWTYRQALLLTLPLSLISFFLLIKLSDLFKLGRKFLLFFLFCLIFFNVVLSTISLVTKYNRYHYANHLVSAIADSSSSIRPGVILLRTKDPVFSNFEQYELNYYLDRILNKPSWWVVPSYTSDITFSLPKYMNDPKYQKLFSFVPTSKIKSLPVTTVTYSHSGFSGLSSAIKNFIGIGHSSIRITSIVEH